MRVNLLQLPVEVVILSWSPNTNIWNLATQTPSRRHLRDRYFIHSQVIVICHFSQSQADRSSWNERLLYLSTWSSTHGNPPSSMGHLLWEDLCFTHMVMFYIVQININMWLSKISRSLHIQWGQVYHHSQVVIISDMDHLWVKYLPVCVRLVLSTWPWIWKTSEHCGFTFSFIESVRLAS